MKKTLMAAAVAVFFVGAALAEDADLKWTQIYRGIDLTEFTVDEPLQRVIVARIDTTVPGIGFKTSPPNADFAPDKRETYRETTPEFLQKNGLAIAVNGNFYNPFGGETITQGGDSNLRGLAISGGFVESQPEKGFPSFIVKKDGTMEIREVGLDESLDDISEAVSGPMIVLEKGKVLDYEGASLNALNPRTAIGISQDKRYAFFLTIDGRREGYSIGASLSDVGKALLRVGAYDGLNVDGGGSTTMAVRDVDGEPLVLNWPCNRRISPDGLRYNGNAIGVTAEGDALQPFSDVIEIKHTDYVKWTPVYDGVSIAQWVEQEPLRAIYAARVELAVDGVDIKTTAPNENFAPEERETYRRTTAQFLLDRNLALAVNANFYSPFGAKTIGTDGDSNVLGLAASDGVIESQPQEGFPSFIVKKDGDMEIRDVAEDENLDDILQAVSGNNIVLKDGEVVEQDDKATHPRTGVGFSYDKRFLYFVVIDGRQTGYSVGATYEDVGAALKYCGAYNGLNLDGGGSTTMVVRGADGEPVVLNRPVNGTPDKLRHNGNSIGVTAKGDLQTTLQDGRQLK